MKTLSLNYYFYILDRLEALGFNRESASHVVPFDKRTSTHPSERIEFEALHDLLKLGQSELSIPHIGLRVSKSFRISNYGYAGNIFSTCNTIADAILCAEKYSCLAHTIGRFKRDHSGDMADKWVRYVWTPNFEPSDDEKYRQISECVLSNYALTIKWLSWSFEGSVDKVSFRHSPKLPLSTYHDILDCSVEFEAEQNAFLIDRALLETPIPTANPIKLSLLEQKLNRVLAEYNQASDLIGRLEYAVRKMIVTARPSFGRIANELALSERALKRYLSKKDIGFQDVVRKVKMDLCDIYIQQGVPYSEIAQLLWYSDQSAFTRAYKNWHGVSPKKHTS